MNINSLVMDQYKSGCCNITINKKQKTNVLETFLKFLNDKFVVQEGYFLTDIVAGDLDHLSFAKQQYLLDHLEYCHEKINHQHTDDYMKIYEELFNKTIELFKSLNLNKTEDKIIDATNQFLFLIAHRDGKINKKYTRTASILKNLFEKDLKNYKNAINTLVRKNGNTAYYIEAKNDLLKHLNKFNQISNKISNLIDKWEYGDTYIYYESISELHLDICIRLKTDILPAIIFDRLNHIKFLNLSHNQISEIHPKTFNNLVNLKGLNLSNNKLQILQPGTFNKLPLKELDLSHNQISEFHPETFTNLILMTLNLTDNKIISIETNIFSKLTNLYQLNLSHNQIREVIIDNLKALKNLKILDLQDNQIKNVRGTINNIQEINLYNNPLSNIKSNIFQNLNNCYIKFPYHIILNKWVQQNGNTPNYIEARNRILNCIRNKYATLDLSSLGLRNLPSTDIFQKLLHITSLNLSHNQISEINNYPTFIILTNLINLDLSHNQIAKLELYSFEYLKNLQKLNLSYNQLSEIKNYHTFKGLTNLINLDLSHNQISEINVNSLNNISNIKLLNLSYNQIKEIPSFAFKLVNLQQLYLENNLIEIIISSYFSGLINLLEIHIYDNPICQIANDMPLFINQFCRIITEKPVLSLEIKLRNILSSINMSSYKLSFDWDNSELNEAFKIFIDRINEIKDFRTNMQTRIYKNLANVILTMDKNEFFRKDCISIAAACLGSCADAIQFGYLNMIMAYNILDLNSDYNSEINIFNRIRYHSTVDYIASILRSKMKQLKKNPGEEIEFQVLTLLNPEISLLLKLPASDMMYRNLVVKVFYDGNEDQLNKDQHEFAKMTKEYFNNIDNFYPKLLDNEIIYNKYKQDLDIIALEFEDDEADGNIIAYNNRKNKQVLFLKTKLNTLQG